MCAQSAPFDYGCLLRDHAMPILRSLPLASAARSQNVWSSDTWQRPYGKAGIRLTNSPDTHFAVGQLRGRHRSGCRRWRSRHSAGGIAMRTDCTSMRDPIITLRPVIDFCPPNKPIPPSTRQAYPSLARCGVHPCNHTGLFWACSFFFFFLLLRRVFGRAGRCNLFPQSSTSRKEVLGSHVTTDEGHRMREAGGKVPSLPSPLIHPGQASLPRVVCALPPTLPRAFLSGS